MKYQVWGLAAPQHMLSADPQLQKSTAAEGAQHLSVCALSASAKLRLPLGLKAPVITPKRETLLCLSRAAF